MSDCFIINNRGYLEEYVGTDPVVVVPQGVKYIGSYAFYGNNKDLIQEVILPDSVEELRDTFSQLKNLRKVRLPNNKKFTAIPEGCFSFCKNLNDIQIPNSVTHLGEAAFYGTGIGSDFVLPESVQSIDSFCFHRCTNLKRLHINHNYIDLTRIFLFPGDEKRYKDNTNAMIVYPDDYAYVDKIPPDVKSCSESKAHSGNKGCYVATCVYGSYDCPEVWTLRRFRDDILAKNLFGRLFIKLYYAVSPTAVKLFGNYHWFHKMFKTPLDSLVEKLINNGVENTPYND